MSKKESNENIFDISTGTSDASFSPLPALLLNKSSPFKPKRSPRVSRRSPRVPVSPSVPTEQSLSLEKLRDEIKNYFKSKRGVAEDFYKKKIPPFGINPVFNEFYEAVESTANKPKDIHRDVENRDYFFPEKYFNIYLEFLRRLEDLWDLDPNNFNALKMMCDNCFYTFYYPCAEGSSYHIDVNTSPICIVRYVVPMRFSSRYGRRSIYSFYWNKLPMFLTYNIEYFERSFSVKPMAIF